MSSAADSPDPSSPLLPSPAHIALGLITIRLKPANLDIEGGCAASVWSLLLTLPDYLAMLSASVASAQTNSEPHKRPTLDTAYFWKQAYEKSEREKSQLQHEIYRLEAEPGSLTSKPAGSKKRKADSQQPIRANTQSKRRGLDTDTSQKFSLELQLDSGGFQNDSAKHILREIFHLSHLLARKNPSPRDVCLCIGSFNQTLEATLKLMSPPKRSKTAANPGITTVVELSLRFHTAYGLVLQALDYASTHDAQDNDLTIAYSSIVHLFQVTLGQLHKLALNELTRQEEEEHQKTNRTKPNANTTKTGEQDAKSNLEAASKALTQLLVTLLTSVDPTRDSQCELLEGLLCALIDHIGSSLSLLVFADSKASKGDVGIMPPCGLIDVAHMSTDAAIKAAEIEGPYLIAVLKSVMTFLNTNQERMSAETKSMFSGQAKDERRTDSLRDRVEARMQGTLLRGVFGDDDTTFNNVLRREHLLEGTDITSIKEYVDGEEDKSSWFIGQMWEQLGWDILSRGATKSKVADKG